MTSFTTPERAAVMVQHSEEYRNKVRTLMRDILKSETCVAYLGTTYPGSFGVTGPSVLAAPVSDQMGPDTVYVGGFKYQWGAVTNSESGKGPEECGNLVTSAFTDTAPSSGGFGQAYGEGSAEDAGSAPDLGSRAQLEDAYKSMVMAQVRGIDVALQVLRPTARDLAAASTAGSAAAPVAGSLIVAKIEQATNAYIAAARGGQTAIADASTANLRRFMTASSSAGWMMASSSFFQMGRIRSAANAAMGSLPVVKGRNDPSSTGGNTPYGIAEGPLYEDLAAADTRISQSFSDYSASDSGYFTDFGKNMAMVMGRTFGVDPKSPKHALVQIKDTGDYLLTAVETAAGASLLGMTASTAASNTLLGKGWNLFTGIGDTAKELFAALLPALYAGLVAMFGVAITMSFLLPMLPFMLSIGSVLGWLMALFSAMVAAPVWLAGHLHPEGDGFAGKALGGYMILLETVTRPVFIVFGLIGAFVIMDPMLKFVAWAFRANMSSLQGNSVTGLVSIVVFAMIYVAIVWTVVRQSLQLIFALSEKVYTWIGGSNAGFEQAASFGEAAKGSTDNAAHTLRGVGEVTSGAYSERRKKMLEARTKPNSNEPEVAAARTSSAGQDS